ncbi:hypothetical protein PIB30_087582 [Stylosanthes scabra]|uniref:RNase H type-1 domain-containing protein n=1 Tax=Stylosanthes scabra TaxID=79078 RepID=A0ABU6QSY7_9FABA|nr:hypothetical protein [Stylosanthes scabra]
MRLCEEFWIANKKEEGRRIEEGQSEQLRVRWEAPPTTHVKINVDAAVPKDKNGGVGIIVRDDLGQILAASTWAIPFLLEAHETEAFAAYKGFFLLRSAALRMLLLSQIA